MSKKWVIIGLFLTTNFIAVGRILSDTVVFETLPFSKYSKKKIEKGEILADSNVESFKITDHISKKQVENQSLDFKVAGLHKRPCKAILPKLSRYENYSNYIDFIKKSSYDEKNKMISLFMSSAFLPIDMTLIFVLERIRSPGSYSYRFNRGFLKGLKGKIHISKYRGGCLIFADAVWKGPDTGFPNIILELFSSTAGRLALKKLYRITGSY